MKSTEAHTGDSVAETSKQYSRRTIVKSAAWSVPVITAAAASPLAAASDQPQFDIGVVTGNRTRTGPTAYGYVDEGAFTGVIMPLLPVFQFVNWTSTNGPEGVEIQASYPDGAALTFTPTWVENERSNVAVGPASVSVVGPTTADGMQTFVFRIDEVWPANGTLYLGVDHSDSDVLPNTSYETDSSALAQLLTPDANSRDNSRESEPVVIRFERETPTSEISGWDDGSPYETAIDLSKVKNGAAPNN